MNKLDEQEKLIVREIIKDPKISDNQIAIRTNVPLNTVNRKRRALEEKNLLNYFCYLDNSVSGTGTFKSRMLAIIVLKDGITRKHLMEKIIASERSLKFFPKHVLFTALGEYDANLAVISVIESHKHEDFTEIYNAEFVPELESFFGPGCIKDCVTVPLTIPIRLFRNYLPGKNIKNGIIKEDWPHEFLFVDE
jgi:DNA-binding Lrp family transcriptional regulator